MKLQLHAREEVDMVVFYIEDAIKQFEIGILYNSASVYYLNTADLSLGELNDLVKRSRKKFIKRLIDRESENFFQ